MYNFSVFKLNIFKPYVDKIIEKLDQLKDVWTYGKESYGELLAISVPLKYVNEIIYPARAFGIYDNYIGIS